MEFWDKKWQGEKVVVKEKLELIPQRLDVIQENSITLSGRLWGVLGLTKIVEPVETVLIIQNRSRIQYM